MGRLIDEGLIDYIEVNGGYYADKDEVDEIPTVEAIPKADIITMLEEIKDLANDECWDLDREHGIGLSKEVVNLDVIENIIQQKINELKEMENHDVKPIEATPQLSEADSKKIIKEVNTKPNYKRIQKLKDIVNKILLK